MFFDQGKPTFHYNTVDVVHYNIAAPQVLAPGKNTLAFTFQYDGGGVGKGGSGTLAVDGQQVAQGRIDRTIPIRISLDEGLDVGEDTGTPVTLTYDVPFKFTGKLANATGRVVTPMIRSLTLSSSTLAPTARAWDTPIPWCMARSQMVHPRIPMRRLQVLAKCCARLTLLSWGRSSRQRRAGEDGGSFRH